MLKEIGIEMSIAIVELGVIPSEVVKLRVKSAGIEKLQIKGSVKVTKERKRVKTKGPKRKKLENIAKRVKFLTLTGFLLLLVF